MSNNVQTTKMKRINRRYNSSGREITGYPALYSDRDTIQVRCSTDWNPVTAPPADPRIVMLATGGKEPTVSEAWYEDGYWYYADAGLVPKARLSPAWWSEIPQHPAGL